MTDLHVNTAGDPANPALLLVHAFGTDARFWEEPAGDLAQDYFCIMPDLQGAGSTPNPLAPMPAEEHADDLVALLDELGVGRVALAGCAIGGMIAAIIAARRPDLAAGLVMTNPGVRNADEVKEILRGRVAQVREHGMQVLLPSAPERSFHGMPRDERYRRYVERYVAQDAEGYALSTLGFLDIDIRPFVPQIKCPTLIIPGGNDVLMPADSAEVIIGLLPQAEIVRFEDVAHFIPFQAPKRFAAEMRRFLTEKVRW